MKQAGKFGLMQLRWFLQRQYFLKTSQQALEILVQFPKRQAYDIEAAGVLRISVQHPDGFPRTHANDGNGEFVAQELNSVHHLTLLNGRASQ